MATGTTSADDIRLRMAEIRSDLHQNVRGVMADATSATDWRAYLRQRPWLAVGAAFAAGYVMVPRKSRPLVMFDAQRLIGETPPAEPAEKPFRPLRWALGLVAPLALRAAQNYAMNHVEGLLAGSAYGPPRHDETRGVSDPIRPD